MADWKRFLVDRSAAWNLPSKGEWNALFHNNYQAHHSNINLLWFYEGNRFPSVVTKVFRESRIPQREFENLRQIHRLAPAWVPKPLYCGEQGGFWMLWMEGVPGLRFWNTSDAALKSAVRTIADLHFAIGRERSSPDDHRYERLISAPLKSLQQFNGGGVVHAGCTRLAASIDGGWLSRQPIIRQHGDLFIDNLLFWGNRWYIVDWESFGTIDFPFYDLFTLLVSRLRRDGDTPDKWDSRLVKSVPALVDLYAQRLNLSTATMRTLLPLALANWFHLQWSDGREEFASRMYRIIRDYFDNTAVWERVFFGT